MALSAVALCGRALLKIGAAAIQSFDEKSAEAEVAGALYAPLRDALLSAHPWSFATRQARLARLDGAPVADYAHAFQLPADFLRALSAGRAPGGRGLDYRIAERRLHTDAEEVVLTYVFRPGEADTPAFFDQALIARLAAELCIPLTESTSRGESLSRLAEEELRRARLVDAQQDSAVGFEGFPLVEARG
ncbi:MAG: hypothetical protein RID91_10165 [Azospirillaceae bacterium]